MRYQIDFLSIFFLSLLIIPTLYINYKLNITLNKKITVSIIVLAK